MLFLRKASPVIYLAGLTALAIGLPLWLLLMSISQFILLGAWLLDGNIKQKIKAAFRNPVIAVTIGIYLLHIAGLIFTSDLKYALDDLRVKLPLLILPLVIGTMPALSKKHFDFILKVLLSSTFIATVYCTAVWLGYSGVEVNDIRDISVFISHIRFSLIICMCLVIIKYLLRSEMTITIRSLMILLAVWFIIFLFILQSLTGIVILMCMIITSLIYIFWKRKNKMLKGVSLLLLGALITGSIYLYQYIFIQSVKPVAIQSSMLMNKTALGGTYTHNLKAYDEENGNPVWINVCEMEMDSAWNAISKYKYSEHDADGQMLRFTLIRFLTSKNLTKDAAGIKNLSAEEIHAIENGIANVDYIKGSTINIRLKQLAWEYRSYYYSGNPSGHSIMQRFEFWKTGLYIFKKQPLTGTGTGDIKKEYELAYKEINTPLTEDFRLRAHNEYLTMFITFGFAGGIYFLLAMIYPWIKLRKWNDLLYTASISIILLSMIMEDTPESQAGATIMAFFCTFFLFHDYGRREIS